MESHVARVLEKYNFPFTELRQKQADIIRTVLNRKTCFGVLPTGFGKSEVFGFPPLIMDKMDPSVRHICLIVTPLRSLMINQVERWKKAGIECAAILQVNEMDPEVIKGIKAGYFSLVFTSPESILQTQWREMLQTSQWTKALCLVCCDEAHCIHEWGLEFREDYRNVYELRSLVDVPWLFLTATCTEDMYGSILKMMGLKPVNVELISVAPDRPNIFLDFVLNFTGEPGEDLKWLFKEALQEQNRMPKTIIYCSDHKSQCDIYETLISALDAEGKAYLGGDREDFNNHIIGIYHSGIGKEMEGLVLNSFPKKESNLRVLVATIAFGLGVNIPDIRRVIHWNASKTPLSYWQEVGRCSRDGMPGHAYFYPIKVNNRRCSKEMIELCQKQRKPGEATCIRLDLLSHFILPKMDSSRLDELKQRQPCKGDHSGECACSACTCCSVCKANCDCQTISMG